MKLLILSSIALLLPSFAANGSCSSNQIGSTTFTNCTDGSSYTTQEIGGSKFTNGYNYNTGSSWNSSTTNIGDTSFTSGRDSDGNSWNTTTQNIGGTTFSNGRDSNGNTWSTTRMRRP